MGVVDHTTLAAVHNSMGMRSWLLSVFTASLPWECFVTITRGAASRDEQSPKPCIPM